MIQFAPPTAEDMASDIERTQGILDRIFGEVSAVIPPSRSARFDKAAEVLAHQVRRLLAKIEARPRYNEQAERAERLIRFVELAGEAAKVLADENELHPNSTFLRALERSRQVEDAAQEVFVVQPRPLMPSERVEAENDRRDAIDAQIAREAFEAALIEQPPPEPDVDDAPWPVPGEDEEDLADTLTRHLVPRYEGD
jgi:hypothetical protein